MPVITIKIRIHLLSYSDTFAIQIKKINGNGAEAIFKLY